MQPCDIMYFVINVNKRNLAKNYKFPTKATDDSETWRVSNLNSCALNRIVTQEHESL